MLYEIVLIYLLTGALAGFVSGLFGVGGAFTMAPALIIGLPLQGVPDHHVMHLSVGTALAVMATTSAYIAVLRYRVGDLQLPVTFRFVPWIVLGAVGGSLFGDFLPGDVLKAIFMGFILLTILRGIFYKGHETVAAGGDLDQVRGPGMWFHGTLTGITGSLLGPGPAIVIGPYLRNRRYSMPMIAATASALAGLLGFSAAAGYIYGGFNEIGLPDYSLGFLYGPAFAGLAIGAFAGSPLGVRVSHHIPDVLVHRMFIGYLALILFVMIMWGR
ncbi:MAG: sulfite exporter TauE/SafE family protein [Alphaproteobacteria bacterium]|nr:sulfite exporter TauE/SafE family protein [Alphaproteobacteria bacterium]